MSHTENATTAVFSRADVAKHGEKQNGWFIVNNDVYDVSHFYDDHPGGRDVLLASIGTDATDAFEEIHHSKGAMRKMESLKVGRLKDEEQRTFISMKDVASKRSADGAWFVINSKVYNVTDFLDHHPGGRDVLLYNAGGDATRAFTDNRHSDRAYKMMEKYCIGSAPPDERKTFVERHMQGPAHQHIAEVTHGKNDSLLARIKEQLIVLMGLASLCMLAYYVLV